MNNNGGIWFLVLIALLGFGTISHIGATNSGQHTGYVTAIEKEGIFWKTWRVYIKTDPQSSQEDKYCVEDESLISKLQKMQENRQLVTLDYSSPSIVWAWQCGKEPSIIQWGGSLELTWNDLGDPKDCSSLANSHYEEKDEKNKGCVCNQGYKFDWGGTLNCELLK